MSKEVNEKDLENVSGGADSENTVKYYVCYLNCAGGEIKKHLLENEYEDFPTGEYQAKIDAKHWCSDNHKIYINIERK